jgi:predicted DsbA family dithiol-disulfide isomerase
MKTISIDVVSDVVCPWCYVGKRRLEAALREWAAQHPHITPEVHWHTFMLNPDMPPEGVDRQAYLDQKFGGRAHEVYDRVKAAGQSVGLDFAFERIARQPNTVAAHSLIAASELGSAQTRMVEALFEAYFMAGRDLTQASELIDVAESAGMDRAQAEVHLQNAALHSQTIESDQAAREMGVTGVPFFIFNRRVGISGAHEPEVLLRAMAQSLEDPTS